MTNKTYGWIASGLSILMYGSNLDQARLNILGHKGSVILPLFAFFAALFRCIYAKRDYKNPITWSNSLGIITALISIIT
ncbi:MAG TPA: hypothetical protein PLW93_04720, partial [Candidatus Absconditabacterales bacterium]|nr:hypothetical protein [Candidatus Absconditabacterales bacterium]